MFYLGIIYFICLSFQATYGRVKVADAPCKGAEACVFADVFSGYNRFTRPVLQPNTTVRVQIEFVFNALLDIEEKDEIMRIVGFFRAFWHDELLQWNPDDYEGVKSITVPAQEVWLPDIGITNSVSRFYEVTYKRDFHLRIYHNGTIRWSFGGIITTSCDIDLTYYPFDQQHCAIELESWQYNKELLTLELYPGKSVNLDTADDDPQWVLRSGKRKQTTKYDNQFSALKFTLRWERKPLYYYVNIIVPGAYIAIITLGVFWLPIECGEKMSLGITVVLAFSVFQIVIMEITPVSSDAVPQITEMVIMVMTLATASLMSSMFVSFLSDFKTPPSRRVKKVFLYYIPRVLKMRSYEIYKDEIRNMDRKVVEVRMNTKAETGCSQHLLAENHQRSPISRTLCDGKNNNKGLEEMREALEAESDDQRSQMKEDVKEILSLLQLMKIKQHTEEEEEKIKEYWKHVGMAIDRIVFIICTTVFIAYLLYALITLQLIQYPTDTEE